MQYFSTLTRSEGSGPHHSSNSSLATLTSSTSHSSGSTTTGGSAGIESKSKTAVTPASVIQEEPEQEQPSEDGMKGEEKADIEKDHFLYWRQQVNKRIIIVKHW